MLKSKSEVTSEEEVIRLLTINFDKSRGAQQTESGVLSLGNSTPIPPWKQPANYRILWDDIPDKFYKGMNFLVTINPDPNCDWYIGDTHKATIITKYLNLMEKLQMNCTIRSSISIYEYGKYGKAHGKLHFHALIKTKDRCRFFVEVCRVFNKRSNLRHRTCDIKTIKSVKDRTQMINYFKKEIQNKKKCLYLN